MVIESEAACANFGMTIFGSNHSIDMVVINSTKLSQSHECLYLEMCCVGPFFTFHKPDIAGDIRDISRKFCFSIVLVFGTKKETSHYLSRYK